MLADGGLRRSEAAVLTWGDVEFWPDGPARITMQKGKNQRGPLIVAVTESTTPALPEIQPDGGDLSQPVFGLTGETLANRVRAAASAAGLGEGFSAHSPRVDMAQDLIAAGGELPALMTSGRWESAARRPGTLGPKARAKGPWRTTTGGACGGRGHHSVPDRTPTMR